MYVCIIDNAPEMKGVKNKGFNVLWPIVLYICAYNAAKVHVVILRLYCVYGTKTSQSYNELNEKKKNESKREPRIQVHVSLMMGFFFCVRKVRLYTID